MIRLCRAFSTFYYEQGIIISCLVGQILRRTCRPPKSNIETFRQEYPANMLRKQKDILVDMFQKYVINYRKHLTSFGSIKNVHLFLPKSYHVFTKTFVEVWKKNQTNLVAIASKGQRYAHEEIMNIQYLYLLKLLLHCNCITGRKKTLTSVFNYTYDEKHMKRVHASKSITCTSKL